MAIGISSSFNEDCWSPQQPKPVDYFEYMIGDSHSENSLLLVEVTYPRSDTTHYLVYADVTKVKKLEKRLNWRIDPRVTDKPDSPLASFKPTAAGWQAALQFIRNYKA